MLWNIRLRRPSPGTVLGGLALIVATGGVAVAAIPGSDGTLSACVSRDGGLRVIDAEAGDTCHGKQSRLNLVTDSSNIFSRLSTLQSPVAPLAGGSGATTLLDGVAIAAGESYVAIGRVRANHELGLSDSLVSCALRFNDPNGGARNLEIAAATVRREQTIWLTLFGVEPPSSTDGVLEMHCGATETVGQVQATLSLIK